jgi:hypothetical protein
VKLRVFCILAADFAFSVLVLGLVFHFCMKRSTVLHSLHYAVDTMTLRGRLPEPPDEDLTHPRLFKAAEDLASLSVFVLLGFGLGFYVRAFEVVRLRSEFRGRDGAPPWQEWLRENHPEAHENYYGTETAGQGPWKRFRRWLHSM